ncbi:bifunctional aconitate hydratase 2/2-methylisocitrate dehydratase [Desulfopila sp. IMCC35008]|uniref:bifunctional aconitate hydratase 2/2-methylisocitrate dehydratase n=1 Tax=Desulfopila sp. IMCC35008 TaxID=2653858 RepID=UPI0013D72098|nr:bifunctional aconitate hydratase 2/2-methylisocitrate dehydratase [Desulfopila sp. IMCC35008]
MLESYKNEKQQRLEQGLPPLPLTPEQTEGVTRMLENGSGESVLLLDMLIEQIEPGVSKSAAVKAAWLKKVALGEVAAKDVAPEKAVEILGQMGGGYNVSALIELLQVDKCAAAAATVLKQLIKIYDGFEAVAKLAESNPYAKEVLESWAAAEWFLNSPEVPETMELTVYKVDGEINTDDFSPGNQAQSRADIPLHATFFGKTRFPDGIDTIADFRAQGKKIAFAGDVVGTGSSRKSAINSVVWHIGEDIPYVPNKRTGGVVLGAIIAPIFLATARDAGVLPIQGDLTTIKTGSTVTLNLHQWSLKDSAGADIELRDPPVTLLDEYRAGGRLNLIIGRQLTRAACETLGKEEPAVFQDVENPTSKDGQGYTLAQKMLGKACGVEGVLPGTVCEPKMTTVGSQDTTGPMTMQEIAELACLRFKADLFMQSFCHTAAYPKASDLGRWKTMTETSVDCGGVALKPGDGVIHSWLNKMLVPDTVGTGGDSHTRFPLGISFPAGSGLVAFAGALGFMPLDMPESVLVRFTGTRKPGITVRDMVNAIPYAAIQQGLLTVEKSSKKNVFAGTIVEIEGVDDLTVDEAFELSDASAERSAAACTVKLSLEKVVEKVKENVAVLEDLVKDGYQSKDALERRIEALKRWLAKPELLSRDDNAEFAEIVEVDLDTITEPILACPNDPDDVKLLSEVAGVKIDEAFVGSCMTHLDHLRVASKLIEGSGYAESRLWLAPATKLDRDAIKAEGGLSVFAGCGGRVEVPGCSLCMGNQARVRPGATVVSTSTRNFDNRLGDGSQVYLASTPLTVITALKGVLPSAEEYFGFLKERGLM